MEPAGYRNERFYYTIALLLKSYTTIFGEERYNNIVYYSGNLPITTLKVKNMNEKIFIEALEWADVQPSIRFLEYFTTKINLLDNIQI